MSDEYKADSVNESPTVNLNTVLAVLSIAAKRKLKKKIYDVSGAYLNADLKDSEFMRLGKDITSTLTRANPEYNKYVVNGTIVVELKKALYGLKQAGRAWYDLLTKQLESQGYLRSDIDRCLFTKIVGASITHIEVYDDDLLIVGNDDTELPISKRNSA